MIENIVIPKSAGCYIFKDERNQIIYIGKSKFLPKRVKSYFQKTHDDPKTKALVETVRSVDFVTTASEQEALIVEENLIKLYNPKFNIKGKDDKTIRLYLTIVNERFPKIELVRSTDEVEGEILAQFTSGLSAREIHKLLHQAFPLRSCSYQLSNENITANKFAPCLEFQIGNCNAPCVGKQSEVFYTKMISEIRDLFNFKPQAAISAATKAMEWHSSKLEFEKANIFHHRIKAIQELTKKLEPLHTEKIKKDLKLIGEKLKLKQTPFIIESFDNSHTAGQDGVGVSVRFILALPEKSSYRKFHIKTAKIGDDYSSSKEILNRHFKRLITEKRKLPNLIIMDGGKIQVNAAKEVLISLDIDIDIIGISKDKNHHAKYIHLIDGSKIDLMCIEGREILNSISEEVHRFAIKYHREIRDKI
jgi:excinuclease ABC subunit C